MADCPRRVRLERTKGWRLPPGTVKVDRSTRWGNPFDFRSPEYSWLALSYGCRADPAGRREASVRAFRDWIAPQPGHQTMSYERGVTMGNDTASVDIGPRLKVGPAPTLADIIAALRGRNLACWCQPGTPCHADVLLELANA